MNDRSADRDERPDIDFDRFVAHVNGLSDDAIQQAIASGPQRLDLIRSSMLWTAARGSVVALAAVLCPDGSTRCIPKYKWRKGHYVFVGWDCSMCP